PGKDSHAHRTAGAIPAAMVTSKMAALYFPASDLTRPDVLIEKYYSHADIVLIEGWISGPYPKIEIWRQAVSRLPLFPDLPTVTAVATDDILEAADQLNLNLLPLKQTATIAEYILK
ncbi:MAG: molybdopterin-guanine dinucleotide biosynthesis protein B, partial [Deltaproteobacteria bacterium]